MGLITINTLSKWEVIIIGQVRSRIIPYCWYHITKYNQLNFIWRDGYSQVTPITLREGKYSAWHWWPNRLWETSIKWDKDNWTQNKNRKSLWDSSQFNNKQVHTKLVILLLAKFVESRRWSLCLFFVLFYLAVNNLITDKIEIFFLFNSWIFWVHKIFLKQTRWN